MTGAKSIPWKDVDGTDTEALQLEVDGQYTISQFIELLEAAKEKWGDKKIYTHDSNSNIIGGFVEVYPP